MRIDKGIAERPADIDAVSVNGYGFPRDRGGPMADADSPGLTTAPERSRDLSEGREGRAFAGLEG